MYGETFYGRHTAQHQLQAYVDEGTGLTCFIEMQIMRHYLSWQTQ